jgi:hypothetical protein
MKEAFELHVKQDAENFATINEKLDHLLVGVTEVKTQWKMLGALAGLASGVIGTIAAAVLGSCG